MSHRKSNRFKAIRGEAWTKTTQPQTHVNSLWLHQFVMQSRLTSRCFHRPSLPTCYCAWHQFHLVDRLELQDKCLKFRHHHYLPAMRPVFGEVLLC